MNHIEITLTFYLKSRILIYIVERRIRGWVRIQTVDRSSQRHQPRYACILECNYLFENLHYLTLWRTYQITTINHSLCTQKQNEQ